MEIIIRKVLDNQSLIRENEPRHKPTYWKGRDVRLPTESIVETFEGLQAFICEEKFHYDGQGNEVLFRSELWSLLNAARRIGRSEGMREAHGKEG